MDEGHGSMARSGVVVGCGQRTVDQAGAPRGLWLRAGEHALEPLEALVLGIVQGATEYIPVSSTAHLLITPWLFGWEQPSFAFNVLVQLGTLGAVCVYLRRDLKDIVGSSLRGLWMRRPLDNEHAQKGWLIVLATLPAVFFGLLFEDAIEEAMGSARHVLIELFVNGLMLMGAEALSRRNQQKWGSDAGRPITAFTALMIGFGQALAILPSISRSGATIAAAMVLGVRRGDAARFSFLMSIPVMLGAGVLKSRDLLKDPELVAREGSGLLIAFIAAAVVGFVVIAWLQRFLRTHTLYWFGGWCCLVATLGLAFGVGEAAVGGDAAAATPGAAIEAPAAAGGG
jgi:undecaprenyl-diphosphatase